MGCTVFIEDGMLSAIKANFIALALPFICICIAKLLKKISIAPFSTNKQNKLFVFQPN